MEEEDIRKHTCIQSNYNDITLIALKELLHKLIPQASPAASLLHCYEKIYAMRHLA